MSRLEELTQTTFHAYNTDGPPERVYRAVSGHDVPLWHANKDSVVKHKWRAATSHAAIAGAESVIALVAAGETDPEKLRAAVLAALGCGEWDNFANTTGPNPHAPKGGKAIGYSGNAA
jgi:hypothetical protein